MWTFWLCHVVNHPLDGVSWLDTPRVLTSAGWSWTCQSSRPQTRTLAAEWSGECSDPSSLTRSPPAASEERTEDGLWTLSAPTSLSYSRDRRSYSLCPPHRRRMQLTCAWWPQASVSTSDQSPGTVPRPCPRHCHQGCFLLQFWQEDSWTLANFDPTISNCGKIEHQMQPLNWSKWGPLWLEQ